MVLDQVGKDRGLVPDSPGPCPACLDTAKLVASEGCFLIDEAVVVVDAVIVECEGIAENHERHNPRNVVEIAGVGKVATFDSVGSHNYFLAQVRLVQVEGLAIYPFDLAAWYSAELFSLESGLQDLVDAEVVNMTEPLSCDENFAETD